MIDRTKFLQLDSIGDVRRALFDAMTDGVLVVDDRGRILDFNPVFQQRLGYEREELLAMTIAELDIPVFAAKVKGRLAEIGVAGEATFETAHRRKDGSVMHVELSSRAAEVRGKVVFFSIVRDIGRRKALEESLHESVDVYQAVINTPALGFWVTDLQGRFLDVNDAYVSLSGYSRAELLQMRIADVEAMERPAQTTAHIERLTRDGYDRFRSAHRRKDGTVWPVEIVTTFSELQGGRFFVFIEDIGQKVEQENRLELASTVFETMDQAVVITDAENRIISINPAVTRLTGYTFDELRGENPRVFASGRHDEAFYATMWHALKTEGHWEGEIWDRRKDGAVHVKWLTINVLRDARGRPARHVSVFSDITERKRTEGLIWRQANFDALTGLPNRHLLQERLAQELKAAQRAGTPLALLFIDLDRFKAVNDRFGHAMGDALLLQASQRIVGRVRDTGTVARLGGDEFMVLLPGVGSGLHLEGVAQAIIDELGRPYGLTGSDYGYVTASVGITLFPEDAQDLEGLLRHADQALYAAKEAGRNRLGYFTASMQEEAREKMALTHDLRHALAGDQFRVYYQPIVDLASGEIVKAEALLRWLHPERGMVSPMLFIPLAEEAGLIHEIGEWVFRQAVASVERWCREYGRTVQVSVNKSPLQFERPCDPSWAEQLAERGLPGNSITVEITEGSLLSTSPRIRQRLLEFRNAGIEVSIDDFGTGFSALSYLRQFDIDYLKIDRSFISDLEEDVANTALVEAIIVMARKLGIKTIAEGVETGAQRDLLGRFGCDYAQGFLYAKPLPAEEFERLISGLDALTGA